MSDITHSSPRAAAARRGILVIISSPSGAGKTTLARRLLAEFDDLEFSISVTTRAPRKSERDGVDYRFVSAGEFDRMIAAGEFAEWAQVHGNRYGTLRQTVERALSGGRDVLFDIDWQGGKALAQRWFDDALKIFVLPPDLATLEARLRGRGTDSDAVIRKRLDKAIAEIRHYREYQHVIVNDDLEEAYSALRAVYLIRRYGSSPRDDVVYPLARLAEIVRQHKERGPAEYAESLIAGAARSR
ncbi:MAG: guanylate kinase [Proteobacteria bacterium]|nr:guanylate kinase [Pseudomonadota bacterium]